MSSLTIDAEKPYRVEIIDTSQYTGILGVMWWLSLWIAIIHALMLAVSIVIPFATNDFLTRDRLQGLNTISADYTVVYFWAAGFLYHVLFFVLMFIILNPRVTFGKLRQNMYFSSRLASNDEEKGANAMISSAKNWALAVIILSVISLLGAGIVATCLILTSWGALEQISPFSTGHTLDVTYDITALVLLAGFIITDLILLISYVILYVGPLRQVSKSPFPELLFWARISGEVLKLFETKAGRDSFDNNVGGATVGELPAIPEPLASASLSAYSSMSTPLLAGNATTNYGSKSAASSVPGVGNVIMTQQAPSLVQQQQPAAEPFGQYSGSRANESSNSDTSLTKRSTTNYAKDDDTTVVSSSDFRKTTAPAQMKYTFAMQTNV